MIVFLLVYSIPPRHLSAFPRLNSDLAIKVGVYSQTC